jgi:hypothetical protein
MQKYILLFTVSLIFLLACSEGSIPTAVDPLIELQAAYVTYRPEVDGILDEALWDESSPYQVRIGEVDPKTGQIIGGYNVEMKALWWREWNLVGKWTEVPYVAISLTWPDDDKNLDKNVWQFNPTDSRWTLNRSGSDWIHLIWGSTTQFSDLWYWDAATTNPLGYMEDEYLETFEINDSTEVYQFNIDGLRFLNDIADQNNCWDLNYNDNHTPRDSTDDFPMKIWKADPAIVPPTLPRVFSETSERSQLLLQEDAEFMLNATTAPFRKLTDPISVPGYVLEDPQNASADIYVAGRYENGFWTIELIRPCITADDGDVSFNPNSRYSSNYFSLIIGDNSHTPFTEMNLSTAALQTFSQAINSVRLNFEFVVSTK